MPPQLASLQNSIAGDVIRPDDAAFDEARALWNAMIDKRPAAIARCTSAADVAATIRFARESSLELSVRGGGHGVAGNAMTDGGIVVDLTRMKRVDVDPEARRARAQGGVILGELDAATQEHGLATTLGAISLTGIAGLTLGGGLGWLMRKQGLACDNLVSAEVVTAAGEVVTANDESPELLWALRGGGGNFGVVTSFDYRLYDVGPIVYGGLMAWPAERRAEVLAAYRDWAEGVPSDIGASCFFVTAPPLPFVPADLHFKPIVAFGVCWTGDHAAGERIVAPMRELGPVFDVIGPMPYTAQQQTFDAGVGPGKRSYWKAGYLAGLSDDTIETYANAAAGVRSPMSIIECQLLGGQFAAGEETSSFGNRDAAFLYNVVALWEDASADAAQIGWARGVFDAFELNATGGVYTNYMTADEGDRVRDAFGDERYARLQAVKRAYDPDNVFHLNQNIVPA